MATVKVMSTCNHPLYLNYPGGRSQKIPARSVVEVEEADLNCDEMVFHLGRGNITVVRTAAPAKASPQPKPKQFIEKAKDEKGVEG